ncbi:MAG: N-acetylmuramic acid 6-phosphate etherase [Candidatus Omnitrophica bacterium]|nr:N-acetylmuramic acid 6-phosphate etherase [Candidatus Omnitrophota bacterium]
MSSKAPEDPYSHLTTEQPNPESLQLDRLSPVEFLDLMQAEDQRALAALESVREPLAEMIERLAQSFRKGGRLFYVGAGTSGRLGMLDATECPPTFGVPDTMVQAILAGGYECLVRSVEGAEDDHEGGRRSVAQRGVANRDFVVGIAASSTTPFVRGALEEASRIGAESTLLTCHENPEIDFSLTRVVVLRTGPEVLTGSTRLKAGTATKLFLNRLTTGAMIQIGKVFENRMVDLYLTCDKLRERAIRTTRHFTELGRDDAISLLKSCEGSVKAAILSHRLQMDYPQTVKLLDSKGGNLGQILREYSKE